MRIQNIYTKNAEYQRYETLKRNREKRSKQGLAFLEGVQPVEQAIAHGYEFYAMCVMEGKRLSGWAEDMISKAKIEVLHKMDQSLFRELSDRENPCEILALVIGNETFGLSKAWKEKCDVLVKIPIFGAASSLNAGCAATVCFYEINRQRRQNHEND